MNGIQRTVLSWFGEHARAFPWRGTRDPYRTLVAETMLQQTQTSRIAGAYPAFLKRFPSVRALARATAGDVIHAWSGLGYNRRAVNLRRAANVIVTRHHGVVPDEVTTLRTLPGVGAYTASAVACFAYDEQVPVVDVNVRRVLSRVMLGADDAPARDVERVARELLPAGRAYEWNQALMDLGALLCRAEPLCDGCPMRGACKYRGARPPRGARAPKERFEGSRRQARGAIVERLRAGSATVAELRNTSGRDVDDLLAALEKDGLIVRTRNRVSLP